MFCDEVQTKWMPAVSLNAWTNSRSRSASVAKPSLVPARPIVVPSIKRTSRSLGGLLTIASNKAFLRPCARKSPE